MPVYAYEAMDNAGAEVKDTIEAASEQEAQTLIRQKGYFPTRIVEKGRGKKDKGKDTKKKKGGGGAAPPPADSGGAMTFEPETVERKDAEPTPAAKPAATPKKTARQPVAASPESCAATKMKSWAKSTMHDWSGVSVTTLSPTRHG